MRDTRYSVLIALLLCVVFIIKGVVFLLLKMFNRIRLH